MAKSAALHGQAESCPCTKKSVGVISTLFLRQFMSVLASTVKSIDANTHDWPQAEKVLATGGICLATGGKGVGHRTGRSLIGVERDLGTLRKGSVPLNERFGKGLSP